MKSTKLSSLLNAALGLTLGALPFVVHASPLVNGTLTIKSGVREYLPGPGQSNITGSWFGMDNSGDSVIAGSEKTALQSGTAGIVLGSAQAAGSASHSGAPLAADANAIDKPWGYFGNTGMHYTSPAITVIGGDTANGADFSGWKVSWNGASIPMGAGAWSTGVSGVAAFATGANLWSGNCGDPYRLNYFAIVPTGDPSNFGDIKYQVHLEGYVFSGTCSGVVTTSPVDLAGAVNGSGVTIDPAVIAADTTSISVTFNEAMVPGSVTSAYMSVNGGVTVTGNPTPSAGNTVFTFPVSGVAGGQTYTMTLGNGVTPVAAVGGHTYKPATAYARTFTTFADLIAPTVVSTAPANGATIAPNTGTVSVTFSEPVTNVLAGAISITGGVTVGAPAGSNSNRTWTFPITSGNLTGSTTYTLSFNAGPKDPSNNALDLAGTTRTFTTSAMVNPTLSSATGDTLLVCSGSKFGMEVSAGNTTWTSITQYNPITIGFAQAGGNTHSNVPNGSETLAIDNAWSFFGNTGLHYTTTAVTDYGNGTMNFSGWRVSWNGLASINMGGGLPATFTWNGVYGGPYTLTYQANVPPGDPSNFGGVLYTLNLTGVVNGGPSNVNAACAGSVVTPKGSVAITNPGGGLTVSLNSQMVPDSSDPAFASSYSTAGAPAGYDFYKYGAITYTVTGLTQGQASTVTFTLPDPVPTGTKLYKISSAGYREIASAAYTIAGSTITLNVVDDGDLDTCKAPVNGGTCAVGVFIDPLAIGVPIALAADATGSATGGSGGCAYNPNGKFDLGMLLALFGSLGYLGWRRTRQ